MEWKVIKEKLSEIDPNVSFPEESFSTYLDLLLEWNGKMNLTAITDPEEMEIKHFYDSLTLFQIPEFQGEKKVLDLGTGAGFPGIPLKLVNSNLQMTLLDSLKKRITFLEEVIRVLGLKNIEAIHGRGEELGRDPVYRESYDLVVSRAVASQPTLLEYCLPFVKIGGLFVAMKGISGEEEAAEGKKAMEVLGGKLQEVKKFQLPGGDTRTLIVVEKKRPAPKKYPRAGGKPRKSPIR